MSAGARPPTHAYSTTISRRPIRRVCTGMPSPFSSREPAVRPSRSAARSTASASCDGIIAVRRNTMTTETYDWPAIVEGLNRYLRLRSIPIGMKLFETVEAMEAIPKIRRPKARHTTDQIVAQARQLGWTVGITMADLIGAQCGAVIGLHPQDSEWLSGKRMAGVWFKTIEDASAHQHAMECVPYGRYAAMAVSPLTSGRLDPPDVCLIYGTPGQMILFINGLQWSGYKKMSFTSVGESACADSWGKALKTGEPALTIPCYAERRYGGVADDELLMAIPPRFLPKVIEGLAALDKNGLRYPGVPRRSARQAQDLRAPGAGHGARVEARAAARGLADGALAPGQDERATPKEPRPPRGLGHGGRLAHWGASKSPPNPPWRLGMPRRSRGTPRFHGAPRFRGAPTKLSDPPSTLRPARALRRRRVPVTVPALFAPGRPPGPQGRRCESAATPSL